ncbi:MAG: hypothetical protein WDN69_16740 [Aliidongia sp.]
MPARSARFGYGDTELGVKYRFVEEDDEGWRPQIGIYPNLEIPTGSVSKQLGTGEVRGFLPVWLQKSIGDWTSFGGGGYWINPPNGLLTEKDYWFAGWALMRRLDDEWNLGGEIFYPIARWPADPDRRRLQSRRRVRHQRELSHPVLGWPRAGGSVALQPVFLLSWAAADHLVVKTRRFVPVETDVGGRPK